MNSEEQKKGAEECMESQKKMTKTKQIFRIFNEGNLESQVNDFLLDNRDYEIQSVTATHPYSNYLYIVFKTKEK